jgi:cation diffusion facilitator family transporter
MTKVNFKELMSTAAGRYGKTDAMAHDHGHHTDAPVRIAAISLVVTAALLVLKLVLGLISGSIAVLGDAVDSATDLTAGAAALISVRIAALPADEEHPYGHGKVETISAAVAATIIGVGGGIIVYSAARRLIEGGGDIDVGVGLVAVGISAAANIVLAFFMRREAKRSHSMALNAEATHLQTNVVQASTIIAGLLLVAVTGNDVFDPLVALGLAAYMGWTALGLVRIAASEVMDTSLPDHDLAVIRDVLVEHREQVRGFHRLRTRRAGAVRHVDMHVLVDPELTVQQVHPIADGIEQEIEARLPGTICVIHVEPDDGLHAEEFEALIGERDAAGKSRERA